jgi:hypothetical protein
MLIMAALILGFTALSAMFAGIDGKWKGAFTAPDGNEYPVYYTLKTNHDKISGTALGMQGPYDLVDGKIKGDSIWFAFVVGNSMKISNTGKYYPMGDSIRLDVTFLGTSSYITLKRDVENK